MNSFDTKKAKDFEEFKALAEELEAAEARPYAPDPSPQFKHELRQQLLHQHERRGLSRLEMGRLWRFAGTAVSLLLLFLAVAYFWTTLSNSAATTGSGQDTVIEPVRTALPDNSPVPMSLTFTESDEPTDRTWVISATQKARPSAASPVEFEVTVGYEFTATQEVFMKLHYASPEWETFAGDGRPPIDGMGDWAALNPDTNSITLNFTGNPSEMAQIVGTEQPVLVVQMGYFVGEGDGRRLEILASQTFANVPFDLTNLEEIRIEMEP